MDRFILSAHRAHGSQNSSSGTSITISSCTSETGKQGKLVCNRTSSEILHLSRRSDTYRSVGANPSAFPRTATTGVNIRKVSDPAEQCRHFPVFLFVQNAVQVLADLRIPPKSSMNSCLTGRDPSRFERRNATSRREPKLWSSKPSRSGSPSARNANDFRAVAGGISTPRLKASSPIRSPVMCARMRNRSGSNRRERLADRRRTLCDLFSLMRRMECMQVGSETTGSRSGDG